MQPLAIPKHKALKPLLLIFGALIIAGGVVLAVNLNTVAVEQERIQKLWDQANNYCSTLFSNDIVKNGIAQKDLSKCEELLNEVYDQDSTKSYRDDIKEAKKYLQLKEEISALFTQKGTLRADADKDRVSYIESALKKLKEEYQTKLKDKVARLRSDYNSLNSIKEMIFDLFENVTYLSDLPDAKVKDEVNRDRYNQAIEAVERLSQASLKEQLSDALLSVKAHVEAKEEAERKRQIELQKQREKEEAERQERERIRKEQEAAARAREAEIASAWHTMTLPYISQNRSQIYNGCEAASLLISLKHKGLLKDKSFKDFADEMPKTDDPQTGFILSIYDSEPTNETHWIDVAPLVEYGITSSGSNNIENLTGSDISVLRDNVINGNPVVIYLTYNLNDPKELSRGVPLNLHVVVLSGYNTITNEYQITDPWTRNSGQYILTFSGDRVASLYDQIGRRALVVK